MDLQKTMEKTRNNKDNHLANEDTNSNNVSILLTALLLTLVFVAILSYWAWFHLEHQQNLSTTVSDWGAFGDYIGGIANPLVALSALIWLTRSVTIQRRELVATRKELHDANKHHEAMKGIADCRAFSEQTLEDINEIEKSQIGKFTLTSNDISVTNENWELGKILDRCVSEQYSVDSCIQLERRLRHSLRSLEALIEKLAEVIQHWEHLHGSSPCYSAATVKMKVWRILASLYAFGYLGDEHFKYLVIDEDSKGKQALTTLRTQLLNARREEEALTV